MTNNLTIRQIGNDILETPVKVTKFTNLSQIKKDIAILLQEQKKYGGVGISSNQCLNIAEPTKISIIGSDDEETRKKAKIRYPGEFLPYTTKVLNLKINKADDIYYPKFGEGCLSVLGPIRGKVKRYKKVIVNYQSETGETIIREVNNLEAHIFQHEYDHLQGETFLEKIFADCTKLQISDIKKILNLVIKNYKNNNNYETNYDSLPIIFDRDTTGNVTYNQDLLKQAFLKTPNVTLLGIKKILEKY